VSNKTEVIKINRKIIQQCFQISILNNTKEKHPEYEHHPHFSFIIQDGKLLEWGINRKGDSHFNFGYPNYSKIHAETEAYRKAKGILNHQKKWSCINIRLDKKNNLKISCPCERCFNFLSYVGCSRVFFSTPVGFSSAVLSQI